MIIIETNAGLCNRMRSIASAVVLGREYAIPVKIIWPRNKALNCRFDTLFEGIPGVVSVAGALPVVWRFSGKTAKLRYRNAFVGTSCSDSGALIDCIKTVGNSRDIYINSFYTFYQTDAFRMFIPKPAYLQAAEALVGTGRDMIGIHIRRGDNQRSIAESPTALFIDAVERELARNPSARFFLATDSPADEKALTDRFGSRIVVNRDKDLRRYSSRGIQDALIDLLCLSRCDTIYGSFWSSFSETAAAYGQPSKLIVLTKE